MKKAIVWTVAIIATLLLAFIIGSHLYKGGSVNSPLARAAMSWPDRAEIAVKSMMDKSAANIAGSIQGLTHPSGSNPKMTGYNVRRVGDSLSVKIETKWQGGLTKTDYTTRVVWEFSQTKHVSCAVVEDNAAFAANADAKQKLDDYFRTECYANLRNFLKD